MEALKTILEKLVESQQQLHILVAICVAICLILLALGYIAGKISSKRRLCLAGVKQRTRQAELEVQKIAAQNAVELQRMAHEEKAAQHQRDLETMDRERAYRLRLAEKFEGLEPVLRDFLVKISSSVGAEFNERMKERRKFRQRLIDKFVQDQRNQEMRMGEFWIDSKENGRINGLVDAAFPLTEFPQLEIPEPFRKLIDMVYG